MVAAVVAQCVDVKDWQTARAALLTFLLRHAVAEAAEALQQVRQPLLQQHDACAVDAVDVGGEHVAQVAGVVKEELEVAQGLGSAVGAVLLMEQPLLLACRRLEP